MVQLNSSQAVEKFMPPKFGTSGLRGLVTELTDDLIRDYVVAFARSCEIGKAVYVGRDLRDSSPRIATATMTALRDFGLDVVDCGAVVTPALAMAAMANGSAAIMVTGSHIPADRNGIKFYTPDGEIKKTHEAAILANLGSASEEQRETGEYSTFDAEPAFVTRYVRGFGAAALKGRNIGVYAHSTVGRDLLQTVLAALGAKVTELGRSDTFIPVDTEAVDPETRAQLKGWAENSDLDAIVSMDGDGDRPLLTDEKGEVIPGDILGQVTAQFLNAKHVVTPVSSNTGVNHLGFVSVRQTKIGSPFVIAGMEDAGGAIVGYEANGGFLLGFEAEGPAGLIDPLMTRDSVLPLVSVLAASQGRPLSVLMDDQPQRFTAADRLQNIEREVSLALIERIKDDPAWFASHFNASIIATDETDGFRMTFVDHTIIHVRPSGNAPELRVYVETESAVAAGKLLDAAFSIIWSLAD